MAITPNDIKLLESERMRDTPDGGGRMTSRVIPSGQAGNVFPKVSRVDSVYGRVNLRKIYQAVRTATLDMYAGAHLIITEPPSNERISCVLFSTGSSFDQRSAARDRIESYVVTGPLSRLRLYGTQLIGQRAVAFYQRPEEPLPEIGEVLVLSVESGGGSGQQFVRIADIDHEVRTFTDERGDYQRRVVTLGIGAPLAQTFTGAEPTRNSVDPSPTKVRVTQVADASRYYGIQPLAEPAMAGDLTVRVSSIYTPLVPSTQRETAISLANIAGAVALQNAGAPYSVPRMVGFNPPNVHYFLQPVSSLYFVSSVTGERTLVPGTTLVVGGLTVSLSNDGLRFSSSGSLFYTVTSFVATPGVNATGPAHTLNIPVTLGTRGTVYSVTLGPVPAPGTVVVDFRALGRWYRFRDNGAGVLVPNDPSEGTGSVDYVTGAVVVTLGALPDVGSAILFAWGSPVHYTIRAGATSDAAGTLRLDATLLRVPVVPGTVVLSYPVGGVTRSVTDAASNGVLSGTGASGTIDYASGEIVLNFSTPPDRGAFINAAYTRRVGDGLYSGTTATISGGSFTVPGIAPFRSSGSFTFQLSDGAGTAQGYIRADGQVRIRANRRRRTSFYEGYIHFADQQVGSFNAATGVVTLTSVTGTRATYTGTAWTRPGITLSIVGVSGIVVERDTEAFDPDAVTDEAIDPVGLALTLDLTATTRDAIIPGSLIFSATGKTYSDRGGFLVTDVDPVTGSGTPAGSVDYETGIASLTLWGTAAANVSVSTCLTTFGEFTADKAFFRTAGSPLRPASFYVQAVATDGTLVTGTANQNGEISGALVAGEVEQAMGVVAVEFGAIEGGLWVPKNVYPSTIRYNCVVLSNLPLDANILGLDPVRLPSDGRVPVFRPADVAVLHNTQRMTLPNPVSAGATYDVEREGLAVLRLVDANGAEVPADRYLPDLAAGTVTMAADWNGTGVAQPLVAVHRIEDMLLVSDVQINGQVSFAQALLRDYPDEGTYLSSALLFGDLQAMVTSLFDQQTWTGVWSNTLIGSQASAQYNDIDYPVEVLNESAVTERWRINFTSTTAFQVFGENLGQIATGSTATDLAPINPVTGEPYFVLRAAGWGGGWATGNNLRFNTQAANGPAWIARTILAGASLEGDKFDLEGRGDVD